MAKQNTTPKNTASKSARITFSKEELQDKAKPYFVSYPKAKAILFTNDGMPFLESGRDHAQAHAQKIGSPVWRITPKNIAVDNGQSSPDAVQSSQSAAEAMKVNSSSPENWTEQQLINYLTQNKQTIPNGTQTLDDLTQYLKTQKVTVPDGITTIEAMLAFMTTNKIAIPSVPPTKDQLVGAVRTFLANEELKNQ